MKKNLILGDSFLSVVEKKKWVLNFFLLITIIILSSILTLHMVDFNGLTKEMNLDPNEEGSVPIFANIFIIVLSFFSTMFSVILHYFFFLIVVKLANSKLKPLNIMSASIFMQLIIAILSFLGIIIQLIFNVPIEDYNILSLNILDKGNDFLSNINVTLFLQSYLVFLILYINVKLQLKLSMFISLIYLSINILIHML